MTDIIYGCSLALKMCIILERFDCLDFFMPYLQALIYNRWSKYFWSIINAPSQESLNSRNSNKIIPLDNHDHAQQTKIPNKPFHEIKDQVLE